MRSDLPLKTQRELVEEQVNVPRACAPINDRCDVSRDQADWDARATSSTGIDRLDITVSDADLEYLLYRKHYADRYGSYEEFASRLDDLPDLVRQTAPNEMLEARTEQTRTRQELQSVQV